MKEEIKNIEKQIGYMKGLYENIETEQNNAYKILGYDYKHIVTCLDNYELKYKIKDYESMLPHEDGSYNPRLEKLLYVNSNNIQNDNIYYKEIYDFYIKHMDIIDFIERKGFYYTLYNSQFPKTE